VLLVSLVSTTLAWDAVGATWPTDAFPLPYWVSDDFGPDLDDAAALASVQAAFDTWAAVDCAGVSFTYMGRVSDATWGESDGRNVVFFVTDSWPGEASLVSAPSLLYDGSEMVDVDIALNGHDYAWSIDAADGRTRMDVQGSVTHEVGHLLGLWHSTTTGATLNPSTDGSPDARSLEEDDTTGLCALYDVVPGDGALGDACTETTDCGAGLFCLADGDDRYCSASCDDATPCAGGFTCLDLGDGTGACAVESATGECGCAAPGGEGALGSLGAVVLAAGLARRRRNPR
jgi:MYXO-CTERM domain-containing protein